MKKAIQKKFARIAASATAVAVVATGIASSWFGKPDVSFAAQVMDYDAVSSVNYADILGRGIDYGVVSDQFVQSMHMETTFATNLFTNVGGDQNCDVDLAGDAPAHFIIAEVENGSQVRFGKTCEGADSILFDIETTEDIRNNSILYDNICKADPHYKIDTYSGLKGKVDSMISHVQDESARLLSKPSVNIDDIAEYKNGKAVIDLTDSIYDNAVVYIDIPEDSAIGNNLKGAEVLNIVKNSNTVIVFNVLTPNKVTLPQYTMTIADYEDAGYDFDVTSEVKDGKLTFNSTTTHSGHDSIHNRIVDKEMCQKVIWNIPNSKDVAFDTTAGTFLLPNPETYAYTVGSSAGWIVSAGKTEVRGGEWHYIYHGRSEDGFDKDKSSIHFASYKAFTNKFDGKNTEQIDNIYAGEGEFTFSFTETESNYKNTVKKFDNVTTDKNGRIIFPSLSFNAADIDPRNPEVHYYVIKEVSMKGNDPKISLSKGEIDIELKVVNTNGVLSYVVSSVKYLTGNHSESDIAAVNKDVDMSGIEFGLGGFFNLYDLKTSDLDITKKVSVDDESGFNNKYKNNKYKVAIKKGDLYVQNLEGGLALAEHYFEVKNGETVHISGLVPGEYKVIEEGENLVDYKLEGVVYKINGEVKSTFSVADDSKDINAEVINSYKKLPTEDKALLTVEKEVEGLPTSYNSKDYEVAVLANIANGPSKYLQDASGELGDQPVYFKVKNGEKLTFAVPKEALNYQNSAAKCTYQVIEKKAEVEGYKWSTTYSGYGENVITEAYDVKDMNNETNIKLRNTYTRDTGSLKIRKSFKINGSDMPNCKEFKNAKFLISGPDDFDDIEVSYADFVDGVYTLNNIPLGQYTVTETNMKNTAPDGYGYVSTRYNNGNGCKLDNNNKNAEIALTNEYRTLSKLTINKSVVTIGGGDVSKKEFKLALKNNSGKYYDEESGEFTSNDPVYFVVEAGSPYVVSNIPEGSYTVSEDLSAAEVDGYTLKTQGMESAVYVSGSANINITNRYTKDENAKTYTLNLKKKAIDAPYSDTVYEIAVKKGDQYLVANGDLVSEPYFFKLKNDEEIKLTLNNEGPYTIYEKTENVSENNNFTLETTYEVDGKVVANGAFEFKNNKTKVDALVRNTYSHIGGPEMGEIEFTKINSKDKDIKVSGATYGLYLATSEVEESLNFPKVTIDGKEYYHVDSKDSATDGVVKFENVYADKTYLIREENPAKGYYLSEDYIEVSIAVKNGESKLTLLNDGNGTVTLSKGLKWLEDEIEISVSKINISGHLLEGAVLHIENERGIVVVDQFETNGESPIKIKGDAYERLIAGETYYLVEDTAPDGYELSDPVEFTVALMSKASASGNGVEPVKVKMIDEKSVTTSNLTLKKTIDGENITEDDLKNLKFTVQNEKGEYLSKDEDGNVVITKDKVEISLGEFDKNNDGTYTLKFKEIEIGKYTIKETQANIEGYDIEYVEMDGKKVNASEDKSFTSEAVVTKDGKVIKIVDAYKVQTGDLKITKTIDGKNVTEDDLENLKFTVQNEAGEYLYKDENGNVKTSKDKVEIKLGEFDKNSDGTYSLTFEDVEVGKYTVKETQANIEGYDIEYVEMDGKKVNASQDNSFTSTAVVTKDGKVIEIVDAYKVQTGDLKITKTIDGKNVTEDDLENLKFTVQNEAGEYLYKDSTGAVKTDKNKHEIALGEFDKNSDGTYSLTFENIEIGKYTVKETQANIEGYDIEYVEMDGKKVNASQDNSFTSTAVVTKDGKVIEIVDAYKVQTGDLKITKTIDGKNVTEDDLENLKFTVQNEAGEYLYKEDGKVKASKDKVEIALGEFDKNNDGTYSLTFENIEVGKYTVKETQANIEGYDIEYVKMDGKEINASSDKSYTSSAVVTTDGKVIEIVDAYKVQTGDLKITKTIDGKNVTKDDLENLKFTVQNEAGEYLYKDENGNVKISKDKVEIKLGEFDKNSDGTYSLTFEDVEVGKYTVKETQANIEGYDIEYVEMDGKKVNASQDNSFTSTAVVTKDGKVIEIVDAYKVQTGDLELTKTIDGKNVTKDDLENLKFTVQNENGEYLFKDENGNVKTSKDKVEIALGEFDKNTDGTYSLKFEDIEVGKYTVKETQANIEGYDIEYVEMDGKKVNASADNSFTSTSVVTKDGKVIEIVDAYKVQTGDLKITKTIDGKNVTEDDLENLKFTVQNEAGEYLYKDSTGAVKTDKNKHEIALGEFDKNSDGTYSLTFEDIEIGKYTVKETQANIEGYELEYVKMNGKEVSEGADKAYTSNTVLTKDGKEVTIEDKYKEIIKTGDLTLKKTIDGENITEDDLKNLKFTVQNEAGEYLYKEDGKVKTSKDKVEITLGEFDKNNDGTYTLTFEDIEVGKYTVKETQANIEGYDIEYVKMDGKEINASSDKSYTSNAVVTTDGKVIEIVDAYKVQTGDLKITKTIDGKNVTEDDLENLKFTVQNEAGEYLYKEDGKVKTSKDKVEIALGEFDKNNEGTYTLTFEDIEIGKYTVKETQANIEGYDIEYVEMDGKKVNASQDNSFTSTAVVTKDGKVIEIVDAYKVQTGDLELTKTIDGKNVTKDDLENLKFTVQNEAGEYLYKDSTGAVKTDKNKHEIALGEFDKNTDGTYSLKFEDIEIGKYTVKETQANIEGYDIEYVEMDGKKVNASQDNSFTLTAVVTKDGKVIEIVDAYKVQTGDLELTKTIDGKNVTKDDLENLKFTVQNEDGEYLYKEDGKVKTSKDKVEIALGEFDKNNDGTYTLTFEDIEVGKYTVKETQANIEGYDIEYVEMDGKKVNASQDNSFTSTAVVTKDGKVIEIVDAYKVQTGDLEIKKTIDGENITEDDLKNLKFTVQNEDGEYLYKDENGNVKTSKDKVEISLGEFDKNTDGTYSLKFEDIEVGKYTVKETQANIEGYEIEYVKMDGKEINASSDKSYTSTAVVTKDGKVIEIEDKYKEIIETGDLTIKKTIDGENITEDDLKNLKFTVQNEAGEYLYKEDGKVKTSKDKVEIKLGDFDKNDDGTYSYKFEDIEIGKYTVKETQANIEGYDIEYVEMDGKKVNASTDNSFTSTAVVTKDGKVIEIVDAYKVQTGDLELTKTIDGKNVTKDDLENLKFTVQNEAGEYLYKDSTGAVKTDKNKHEIALGEFDKNTDGTYSLKFEDIEVGKYTVKETQANIEGYELEYVKMNGNEVSEGNDKAYTTNTVVTKDGKTVTIEDKYKEIIETGDLTIKKTIDGENITEDDLENLKFTVQNEDGEYLYKEDGKVKTSKDKVEIALGEFDKNNDGTYTLTFEDIEVGKYTVKETQANIVGYDIEYVEMDGKKVNASADNSFTSTAVVTKDGKVIEIVDAYKVQTGDLTIKKTIDGENITEDDLENLKFTVQNEAGEYLFKKDGKVETSKDKVEIALGEFDKNNDGTYSLTFEDIEVGKYTVKETQANIEGYELEYVKMNGQEVSEGTDKAYTSNTVVTKDGKTVTIEDKYKEIIETGDLTIKKTIDGENITEDDLKNLKFTVQNEDGEYLYKEDGKVKTSKDKVEIALGEFDKNNDGTYSLTFEDIEVGKYTVKETQANIEGYDIEYVKMDGKEVSEGTDKTYTSNTVLTKDGKIVTIEDAYKVQTGDLTIKKTIDGENITDEDLEVLKFTVQNEAGEYLYKDENGNVKTSKDKVEIKLGEFDKNNDGTYTLTFEDIEIGKYTVKETQANIEGYELEYVKMNGSEVSEGADKAYTSNTVVTKDGRTVTIEDKYKEIVETGDLTIKKTIDGDNIVEDDFENLKFTVQNEAGEYLYKDSTGAVKTTSSKHEIALGEFDKNNDGTYTLTFEDIEIGKYTIKETQANIEGYELEYVKMNGNEVSEGTDKAYSANTVLTKDGKTVTIEDAYKVKTGDLTIEKTIDGKNITEDDLKNLKFTVQNEDGEYLYKDSTGAVKTTSSKHEIALGEFDKNSDGTYSLTFEDIKIGKYTVKETQANIEGYDIEYVKMNGQEVSAGTDKAYTSNTELTEDGKTVTIKDSYKVQTGDLTIQKTLDGENIVEDDFENLKFTVQNEAGEYLYKDADGNVKTSKTKHEIKLGDFDNNDGKYTYTFNDIEIGKYTVKETQANIEGYDLEYVKMNGNKVSEGSDNAYSANTVLTKNGETVTIEDSYKKHKQDSDEETESTTEEIETESDVDIETESTTEEESTTEQNNDETQDVVAEESRPTEKNTEKESKKNKKNKKKNKSSYDNDESESKDIVEGEERETPSNESSTSVNDAEGGSSSTPQTGDYSHIRELMILFLSSFAGLIGLIKIKKKNQY